MRFTDNNAITAANMVDADILAGTDVSTGEDKKFPVGNLADYMLANRTQPVGGANQSITSAINAANSKADANTSAIGDLETAVDKKADADGEYDNLVVGTSKQLLSESYTIDRTPYKFRRSPYTDRMSESIVGASVAWNQLADNAHPPTSRNGMTITATDGGFTINGTASASTSASSWFQLGGNDESYLSMSGHKVLVALNLLSGTATAAEGATYAIRLRLASGTGYVYLGTPQIVAPTLTSSSSASLGISNGAVFTDAKFSLLVFDLTAMFGSTVADALYAMGDDGIKLFRSWYPKDYYPYTEATMEHVSGLESHEMVGFNTFDIGASVLGESINVNTGAIRVSETAWRSDYIRCLAETDYYASGLTNAMNSMIAFYDADKNFLSRTSGAASAYRNFTTPQGCEFFIITQYTSGTQVFTDGRDTVCVNISDESMNGTYKPYEKHTYALDASLTLRGLIKYDATKGFYADGDTYAPDGTVTRKYGVVDLGTLNWTKTSASNIDAGYFYQAGLSLSVSGSLNCIMNKYVLLDKVGLSENVAAYGSGIDKVAFRSSNKNFYIIDSSYTDAATFKTAMSGVYLVYELATPTIESAEPYEAIQITDGTEEYVTDCLVPVGHESKYYENLRSKIEGLPTDFSAIICATEATNKASRNYAVGDYLIYNNTLYKVTTAIAANATLTVGTNITATTIMAEIKALQ